MFSAILWIAAWLSLFSVLHHKQRMRIMTHLARVVPQLRRLHDERNALLGALAECRLRLRRQHDQRNALLRDLRERRRRLRQLQARRNDLLQELGKCQERLESSEGSPFLFYNAAFDPIAVIRRHAVSDLVAHPGYLTNFLGVLIDPKFFPGLLDGREGEIEPVPIPANWHADIAEWGAALRAVDLARGSFTVVELGCGWGCWLNNTGSAARRLGLDVNLVGIEGEPGHLEFARQSCTQNGFVSEQLTLRHGIAAARTGFALFPRQYQSGAQWGLEPIFGATEEEQAQAIATASHDVVPMVALGDLLDPLPRVDLLHIDIQGGEADLIDACRSLLEEKVAYLLVGTHSRQIEGRIMTTLLASGWELEIERPAIFVPEPGGPRITVDGVQGWRNPRLLASVQS